MTKNIAKIDPSRVTSAMGLLYRTAKANGLYVTHSQDVPGAFHISTKDKDLYGPATVTEAHAWLRDHLFGGPK